MANRLELTQAYHKVSGSTLEAAAQAARSSFLNLGSWREDDIPRFIQQVVPAMNSAKRNMANYAVGYYKEMAGLAGEKFKMPDIDPASLSTQALRNGVTDDMIWSRPFKSMWTSLSKGNDISDALDAGARRAVDLARTDVQLARRGAGLQARSRNDRIVGYLRTLSGSENCALCYVASTQRYKKKDLLPIHPGCDCGEMPIYGKDDPGQIIDDIRLEATHDAVETRFGVQDRGGREPDYRKIKIQDHGELGPVLTVKGEKFTKLTPAKVDVPIKAPKKVEPKPFAEQIKKKTSKLSGTKIQSDILGEYNAPLTLERLEAIVEGKTRWGKEVGPIASKYVDDVVSVGKRVDQEIVKRVDDAITELSDPALAAQTRKKIDDLSQLSGARAVDLEAGKQQFIARELAKEQKQLKSDIEFERRNLTDNDRWAESARKRLAVYESEDYQLRIQRRAKRTGTDNWEKSQTYKKLNAEYNSLQSEITALREIAENEVAPQSVAYERLYAEKAQEVISEVRELGGKGPDFLTNNKQLQALLDDAKKVYPKDWLDVAEQTYTEIKVKKVGRGSFGSIPLQTGKRRGVLNISTDRDPVFGADGYATTVHEMGHMMEDAVPGLKQLEWAYWRRRADKDPRRVKLAGGDPEPSVVDSWRNSYSGKLYRGGGPEQNYEVFTTGVESIFSGSGYYYPSGQGNYTNPVPQTGTDEDFRQFILGVLLSL